MTANNFKCIRGIELKRIIYSSGRSHSRHDLEGVIKYLGLQKNIGKFCLRHITQGDGQVHVYILVRFDVQDKKGSEEILKGLVIYLKAQYNDYEFEPIAESNIGQSAMPFNIGDMVEISRTVSYVNVNKREEIQSHRSIGFNQPETSTGVKESKNFTQLPYVVPFTQNNLSLRSWHDMLSKITKPCMLDIAVTPLRGDISSKALNRFNDLINIYESVIPARKGPDEMIPLGLYSAQILRDLLSQQRALMEIPGNFYAMHIRLACERKVGPELIQAAGEAVTGPVEGIPNIPALVAGGFTATVLDARQFARIMYKMEPDETSDAPEYLFDGASVARGMPLPAADELVYPGIEVMRMRFQPAPLKLPDIGILIGEAEGTSQKVPIRLKPDDLRRHVQIYGQTGVGKTTAIIQLVREAILLGHGMAVIDPHGDLIKDIITLVPRNRRKDVILFDVSDSQYPVGLNLFQFQTERDKLFNTNEMQSMMNMLFLREHMGPVFNQFLRNLCKALMADKADQGTLAQIPRFIDDHEFRMRKLKNIKDEQVRFYWERTWPDCLKSRDSSYLAYFTSKFEQFTSDPIMRNIIGQQTCTVNFDNVLSQNSILLANMSKGILTEQNSNLLSMIFIARLWNAAIKRIHLPMDERKDFYIFVDEWQNLATDTFVTGLSEARKFGVSFVLANQYISQLPEQVIHSVMGNIGTIMSFRVGAEDSRRLAEYYAPSVNPVALSSQPNYHCYVRMMMDGMVTLPFSMWTKLQPCPPENERKEACEYIVSNSRKQFARPIREVQRELSEITTIEGERIGLQ